MLRNPLLALCSAASIALALPAHAGDASSLSNESRRTDLITADAAGASVAERIAADFPDTFGTPEETRAIVADLRGGDLQGKPHGALGYGEIYVSLALAQALAQSAPMAPADALNEILGRRIEGQGFGAIARDLDLNLGHVVARVRSGNERLETAFARPAARGAQRTARIERPSAPERPMKPERPQRPERPERPERGGRS